MKQRQQLQNRLTELKASATKILDQADERGDDLTDDEEAKISAIQKEADDVAGQIAAIDRKSELRRGVAAIATAAALTVGSPALANQVNDLNPETTHGFVSLAEFAGAVRSAMDPAGSRDERLQIAPATMRGDAPTNYHAGGGQSGDGFTVPPQYRDRIFEVMEEVDEFGPLLDEEPTSAREVKMNGDESTPWGASGVQAYWRGEGQQMNPTRLLTDMRTVQLHELYAFVLATQELLEDSPRLESRLTRSAGQAIAYRRNESVFRGTGAAQPLGLLSENNGSRLVIAKEASQDAATINAQNVLNMFARFAMVPGDKPIWVVNQLAVTQLATLTIGDKPIWLPPTGLAGAPGGYLLGLPIRWSDHASALGNLGDINLMSPKGYYALKRDSGPKFARSMHLFFDHNIEAFRWTTRFGGQPHLRNPIVPPDVAGGANASRSHFVTLAERA